MEQILIPMERAKLLNDVRLADLRKRLKCKIEVLDDNNVTIEGEGYDEYNAKNVVQAFGRGFSLSSAYKLLLETYFFKYIDLRDMFRNKEQVKRIKARIIGEEGRSKENIQLISNVEISIYGDTISMIGSLEDIEVATIGLNALLEGGTHKKAYRLMELAKRKAEESKVK